MTLLFKTAFSWLYPAIIILAGAFTQRSDIAFFKPTRKKIQQKWRYIFSSSFSCPQCQNRLPLFYAFPFIAYLYSHGRCPSCRTKLYGQGILEQTAGLLYGLLFCLNNSHGLFLCTLTLAYLFLCYYISYIDYLYFLIPTEALLAFSFFTLLEFAFLGYRGQIPNYWLAISVPVVWFSLLMILYRFMPDKLGLADIHFIAILTFSVGFPGSVYLPTLASVLALVYFFLRYRKLNWSTQKNIKIPFGVFLSLAFLLQKLITLDYFFKL